MNDPILIDECLSPDLVAHAHSRGHHATHVVFRGLQGTLDADLLPTILAEGFIFVTNNGRDFLTLYARQELHPGFVIIVPGNLSAARQVELFEVALAFLEQKPGYRQSGLANIRGRNVERSPMGGRRILTSSPLLRSAHEKGAWISPAPSVVAFPPLGPHAPKTRISLRKKRRRPQWKVAWAWRSSRPRSAP